GDLFVYDTNTKEVTTQTLYDDVGQSHSWGVYGSMLLAQDGNVYGSAGNRLFRLDADKNLTTLFQSANVRRVVEDHQGRIWFSGGPDQTLMRYNTVATSDEETDTTALSEVISTANSLVEEAVVGDEVGQYPQAAVDALEAAIADAESVLAGNDADQVEVDGAVTSLDQAVTTFKAAVITEASLDTTVLSSAISEANDKVSNAEVGEEEGEYPQTAVDALEAAIADAESVLADNEADQAEVDAAVITLNQASAAFEAAVITDNPGDDSSIPDPNAEVLVSVKAEEFSVEKSVENMMAFEYTDAATEYQGQMHLGGTRDGRWTAYENIDFTGATDIVFTQATNKNGGSVELRLDSKGGELIGSYEITDSEGTFDVVEKLNVPISTVEGTHDLYLVYKATHTTSVAHIISFDLVRDSSIPDPNAEVLVSVKA
uniref:carbohydrate-binding protein n=1 Tax=Radiobacillus sp. PE A8.2 TaxID=3380349 RepID=UPI00388D6053